MKNQNLIFEISSRKPGYPPGTGGGFFAYHGVWAPGVRLFRRLPFSTKALIISLAFTLPLLGVLGLSRR